MVKKREQIVNENYYFGLLNHTNLTLVSLNKMPYLFRRDIQKQLNRLSHAEGGRGEEERTWLIEQ